MKSCFDLMAAMARFVLDLTRTLAWRWKVRHRSNDLLAKDMSVKLRRELSAVEAIIQERWNILKALDGGVNHVVKGRLLNQLERRADESEWRMKRVAGAVSSSIKRGILPNELLLAMIARVECKMERVTSATARGTPLSDPSAAS